MSLRHSFRNSLTGLLFCVVSALFLLVYPFYVIRPFRYQGPRELTVALAVMRVRLPIDFLVCGIAIALFVRLWRTRPPMRPRVAAAVCVSLVVGLACLSRVNVYELMFHPVDRASFSPAGESKLDRDEEVISVKVGRVARAYPIRSMSYHHIMNDVVAGEPIVATY